MAAKRTVRAPREGAPTTDDAIELALEAEASGQAPGGAASTLIAKQAQLVGWQIATERAAFTLKLLTVVVGVVVAVVIAVLLVSASQYRGVTVQPFSVPPEMEARGLNGAAVATRVLDKLTAMQAGTNSIRAANTYANSWGDSVEVEIPQTGVSAGELWKFLRSWLGEEVKITGELVRTDAGLQLTARAGGTAGAPIMGAEAELEAMLTQAAEAIYRDTQPYRYAVYLARAERLDEALAAFERLAMTGDEVDRKWALAGWSLWLQLTGDFDASIRRAEQALEIDPAFGLAQANLAGVLSSVGDADRSYVFIRASARSLSNSRDVDPEQRENFVSEMAGSTAEISHDHAEAARRFDTAARLDGENGRGNALAAATQRALMGDISEGRRLAATITADQQTDAGGGSVTTGASPQDAYEVAALGMLEDWTALAALFPRAFPEPPSEAPRAGAAQAWRSTIAPRIAVALARAGDTAGAQTYMARATPGAYFTLIAQGQLAAIAGDHAAAERWFAQAAARGPNLADAHLAWGRARLERGDATGASPLFSTAATRAPKWADPLKFWGDALLAQGDEAGAIRKYQAAARLAPKWGALHLAWARALKADGREAAAESRLRAALALDLSSADRAAATRLLG